MNWKLTFILVVAVVAFIFLAPVVPAVGILPGVAHLVYFHYYKSISGVFTPFGTSFYGKYYFHPYPFWGSYA